MTRSDRKSLIGVRFGMLVVTAIGESITTESGRKFGTWVCLCDCGQTKTIRTEVLRQNNAKSCGCAKPQLLREARTKHGLFGSPTWHTWDSMRARCTNPKHVAYARYGGRGIRVCDRWLSSIEAFVEDMGKRPDGKELDRIDNNGNYEPGNCRWVDRKENSRNRDVTVTLMAFGVIKPLIDWADDPICKVTYDTLYQRYKKSTMSPEDMLTTPSQNRRRDLSSAGIKALGFKKLNQNVSCTVEVL